MIVRTYYIEGDEARDFHAPTLLSEAQRAGTVFESVGAEVDGAISVRVTPGPGTTADELRAVFVEAYGPEAVEG